MILILALVALVAGVSVLQDLWVDQFVASPIVGVPQLLGHVRNVVVMVDDVGLVTVLHPTVLTHRDPAIHTRDLLLLLLLVWILLYLGHRVDPPMVERFEVSPAGQGSCVEMQVSLLSLADPGWESVVRVRSSTSLGVTRMCLVGGVRLGGHVSWQSVEVLTELRRLVRLSRARLWPGVSQVAGAGS